MQMRTTMRFHLTPVRMGIINKSTNNKGWSRRGEKGILLYCWRDCKLVQILGKTVDSPQKTKTKTKTCYLENPFLTYIQAKL